MEDLAVSVNATHHNFALVVLQGLWLHITLAAALGRFFPRGSCVLNCQREHFYAIAVFVMMVGDRMTRPQRRGQDKSQFILTDRIARPILRSRLRSAISETLKTKRGLVVMRRLFCVA